MQMSVSLAPLFFRRGITFPSRWMTVTPRLRPLMADINYQDIDKSRGIVEPGPRSACRDRSRVV